MKTRAVLACLTGTLLAAGSARASIAYGSINNFDTVNDTGHECHGFEIELEDCHSTDSAYIFTAAAHRQLVANFTPYLNIVTNASPMGGGAVSGGGMYIAGDIASLTADTTPGYIFQGWTENGAIVSTLNSYDFTVSGVRDLVASFVVADVPTPIELLHDPAPGVAFSMEWSLVPSGWILEESPDLVPGLWTESTRPDAPHDGLHHVEVTDPAPQKMFFRLKKP